MKVHTFYIEEKMLKELKRQTKEYSKKHDIDINVSAYTRKCIAKGLTRGLDSDKEN